MNNSHDKNRRFLLEIEQAIRTVNKEVIHKEMPPVTSDRMLSFAISIAKLRLNYIQAAFALTDNSNDATSKGLQQIEDLKLHRERFEEARDAFIALQRAIELDYIATE